MKKVLLSLMILTSAIFGSGKVTAQAFEQGTLVFHLGIGAGSPYFYSGSKSSVPPIHVSGEYGISDKIGIGGLIGYTASKYEYIYPDFGGGTYGYRWKFSYLIIGLRGAYHFEVNDKVDPYLGLMLGYNAASVKSETFGSANNGITISAEPSVGGIAFGAYGGIRYHFSEHVGAFAELGYSLSWFSIGLALRMSK